MNHHFTLIFLIITTCSFAQIDSMEVYTESIAFQQEINKDYSDSDKSPLDSTDLANFEEIPFFPIDKNFAVVATFKKYKRKKVTKLQTSTARIPEYIIFGKLLFTLDSKDFELTLYQSPTLKEKPGLEDYLFLPFTDLTNGETSYGGGRYLDFRIPESEEILINFNKAYNPYCAYSEKYSCPIPPKNNFLDIEIKAGVMFESEY